MCSQSFPPNTASGRALVIKTAQSDNEDALKIARKIDDPWYRAQALAWVARYAPVGRVEEIAKEALDAAARQSDPYRVVAVSAWPVRALVDRQIDPIAESAISRLLAQSDRIAHPVSRLEGLFLLWQAVYKLGGERRRQVQRKFVDACMAADSWKAGDRLAWAATILASDDRKEAMDIAANLREGRVKRQTMRRIEAGEHGKLSEFFF